MREASGTTPGLVQTTSYKDNLDLAILYSHPQVQIITKGGENYTVALGSDPVDFAGREVPGMCQTVA